MKLPFSFSYYSIALLAAALAGVFLTYFTWKKRYTRSATELFLLMLSTTWWSLTQFIESITPILSQKIILSTISYLGIATGPVLFLLFVLRFTGSDKFLNKWSISLAFIIPVISCIMAITNSFHHLLWSDIYLIKSSIGALAIYERGVYFWVHVSYSYISLIFGMIILFRNIFLYKKIYSLQIRIIFLASILPMVGNLFYVLYPGIQNRVDFTPISFIVTGFFVIFAIFRYQFLDMAPIARGFLIDNMDDGMMFLDKNNRISDFNIVLTKIFRKKIIKIGEYADKVFYDMPELLSFFMDAGKDLKEFEIKLNSNIFFQVKSVKLIKTNKEIGTLIVFHNINNLKLVEKTIHESKDLLSDIINFLPDATFAINMEGKVIAWNLAIQKMTGIKKEDMLGKGNYEYAIPFYDKPQPILIDYLFKKDASIKQKYDYVLCEGSNLIAERFFPKLNNSSGIYLWGIASPLFDSNGNMIGAIESLRDITNKKNLEEKLLHLSFHDNLTELYNRSYFEEELARLDKLRLLPISILIADVNGLKLVNDAFGHMKGDELLILASNTLKKCCRSEDIIARWGGDEFIILLTKTDVQQVQSISDRIIKECEKTLNLKFPLSLALGTATKIKSNESIGDILKEAEEKMYRHKLLEAKSVQNFIIKSLTETLKEKNIETELHSNRMASYAKKIGELINLRVDKIDELILLAKLHDIGKVAINENILNKKEKLSKNEWEILKKHSEIGYRIASASPILFPVAEYILHHHEWWDGTGYPKGLKGEEIPLISRILAIIDAYDVMMGDRPYKKAVTQKKAIAELRKFTGIQFDPDLVEKFISLLV